MEDVTDRCKRLSIEVEEEEEEEFEVVQEGESDQQETTKWVLVGRFLTDHPVNSQAMKSTLASIWRPVKGVHVKDLNHC